MSNNGDLLILDWDGVVVNANEIYHGCIHEGLLAVGIDLPPDEEIELITHNWGSTGEAIIGNIHRARRVGSSIVSNLLEDKEALKRACELYKKCYETRYPEGVREIPGSVKALGELAATHTLALATAADTEVLRQTVFPKLGFDPDQIFQKIVSAYDVDEDKAKPEPFIVNKIREELGFPASRTAVVGDAWSDMVMAQKAGVEGIAVLSGGPLGLSRQEAEDMGVKRIIPNLSYLPSVLGTLSIDVRAMH